MDKNVQIISKNHKMEFVRYSERPIFADILGAEILFADADLPITKICWKISKSRHYPYIPDRSQNKLLQCQAIMPACHSLTESQTCWTPMKKT